MTNHPQHPDEQPPHTRSDTRLACLVHQLRLAVDAPWESLAMTLTTHPSSALGDPRVEGSGAWHVRHVAETLRLHARHLVGPETDNWPALPVDRTPIAGWAELLRGDVDRIARWAAGFTHNDDAPQPVHYGGEHTIDDMLGLMLRHVVWHAAAAHYSVVWNNPKNHTPQTRATPEPAG